MKKLFSLSLIIFQLFLFIATPKPAHAAIPISAPSAVLLDGFSNRIIYAKTPHLKRAPASTTKILTAIVVLDQLDLNKSVTIPRFVKSIEPSKAHLRPGERYYVRDLVRATLISSANDAAETVAVATSGSRQAFAQLMNKKARSLGCKNSNFVRSSGLPAANQYSTAYDMALIMREAQRYSFIEKTLATRSIIIKSFAGRKIVLRNHNKLLWRGRTDVVGKTGWTRKARHCFVGQINHRGRKVFVSMLGSHRLWKDLSTLVNYEFGLNLLKARQNQKIYGRNELKNIQALLRRAGFDPGRIDGQIGPSTLRAIKKFQSRYALRPDGIVGPETRLKLRQFEL